MIKFGICIGDNINNIKVAKEAGFDYVESCFSLLVSDEAKIDAFAAELIKNDIKAESVNCFIPGSLKTTGPNVDKEALYAYVEKGMAMGHKIGLKTVVFGSGGSKQIPAGWDYAESIRQLTAFLKDIAAPLAKKYDLTVVTEPLWDCNVIQRVKEGVMLAATVNEPNVGGLVDLFHAEHMGDTFQDIVDVKGSLLHAHIACPQSRIYPMDASEYDYKGFVEALVEAGCPRCSIEGRTDDFMHDAPIACRVLKSLL